VPQRRRVGGVPHQLAPPPPLDDLRGPAAGTSLSGRPEPAAMRCDAPPPTPIRSLVVVLPTPRACCLYLINPTIKQQLTHINHPSAGILHKAPSGKLELLLAATLQQRSRAGTCVRELENERDQINQRHAGASAACRACLVAACQQHHPNLGWRNPTHKTAA